MSKKMLGIFLIILLLAGYTASADSFQISGSEMNNSMLRPSYNQKNDFSNDTFNLIQIFGPIHPSYSNIRIIDGPSSKVNRINSMYNSILPRLILPIAFIYAENITLDISFKKVPRFDNSKFSFITFWGDYVNGSMENITYYFNEIHAVNIINLSGFFLITKARPLRLTPSYFWIVGEYEKVSVST